jgi:DNA primase
MALSKKCLICKGGRKNDCLYFHLDEKTGLPWIWCAGKCQRGYSLEQYCDTAGVNIFDFIKGGIDLAKEVDNEVQVMSWPSSFVPLSDPRAELGVEYVKSRGLNLEGDMYYDLDAEGIVFPYYFENHFCGAQIRFLKEKTNKDGDPWKITTLPGTRLGLLFGMWNQTKLMPHVKAVVVCEGYFNALSLQQAFNIKYGSVSRNPWKFICTSGSGVSEHQAQALKDLKEQGYKVVAAFDSDEAGLKGLSKMIDGACVTHYSLTQDTAIDWNDLLKQNSHEALARTFMKNMRSI